MGRRGRRPTVRTIGDNDFAVTVKGTTFTFRLIPDSGRLYATGSSAFSQDPDGDRTFARSLVRTFISEG